MTGLMLQCGAKPINRNDLETLPPPIALTQTHYPIPHIHLVDQIEQSFKRLGKYEITDQSYGISHEQNRFFAIIALQSLTMDSHKNWETIIGLRNSHDMAFSAGASAGSHVFVCDNLAFAGDVVFGRKHTKNISSQLPNMIDECLNALVEKMEILVDRYDYYKSVSVDNKWFHDIVCRALDVNRDCRYHVIKGAHVPKVLKEWYEPIHSEFEPRNAWSAFNCFTEVQKGIQLNEQSKRTQSLHFLFDQATALI